MALPHHCHNGAAAVAATVFRCSRRLRPLERHLRDLPKREPALPERWVTGFANYGIDRRSARRKCAGTTLGAPLRHRACQDQRQAASINKPWSITCCDDFHPVTI